MKNIRRYSEEIIRVRNLLLTLSGSIGYWLFSLFLDR